MWPLTERIFARAKDEGEPNDIKVLEFVKGQLSDDSHIEHILSQLGDHRAIADRSKDKTVAFDGVTLSVDDLDELHQRILTWIAETIRWGYKPGKPGGPPEEIGTYESPDRCYRIIILHLFLPSLIEVKQASQSAKSSPAVHHQL